MFGIGLIDVSVFGEVLIISSSFFMFSNTFWSPPPPPLTRNKNTHKKGEKLSGGLFL